MSTQSQSPSPTATSPSIPSTAQDQLPPNSALSKVSNPPSRTYQVTLLISSTPLSSLVQPNGPRSIAPHNLLHHVQLPMIPWMISSQTRPHSPFPLLQLSQIPASLLPPTSTSADYPQVYQKNGRTTGLLLDTFPGGLRELPGVATDHLVLTDASSRRLWLRFVSIVGFSS